MKLEIGYSHSFEIRRENSSSILKQNLSLIYLSDLHFNKYSQKTAEQIITSIAELNPDMVLFGGDYIDSKSGLIYLNKLLSSLSGRNNIFAIAGNHDHYFGSQIVKETFTKHNVKWIEKSSSVVNIKNKTIRIDGNFISKEETKCDCSILLLHQPMNSQLFANQYNLALAGHLHACQFVFWTNKDKLYPGKLFYKWNVLKAKTLNCDYFISKGLGDTLPIRYNCKRDLIYLQF